MQGASPVGSRDGDNDGGEGDEIREEQVQGLLLPGGGRGKVVAFKDLEQVEGEEGEGPDGLRVLVAVLEPVLHQVGVPRGRVEEGHGGSVNSLRGGNSNHSMRPTHKKKLASAPLLPSLPPSFLTCGSCTHSAAW